MTVGKLGSLAIQTVPASNLIEFLNWIHAGTTQAEVDAILSEYGSRQRLGWMPAPVEVRSNDQTVAGVYFTALPGDLAMLGAVRAMDGTETLAAQLIAAQVQEFRRRSPQCHIQAAIDHSDFRTQDLLKLAGFEQLTEVQQRWLSIENRQFLSGGVPGGEVLGGGVPGGEVLGGQNFGGENLGVQNFGRENLGDENSATTGRPAVEWRAASELSRSRFERLLGETFDGTLDCPELNGVRKHSQVLESFLIGKPFRTGSSNWKTVWLNGQLAGCLLLTAHNRELVELAYMGLVPAARGKRLGGHLIEMAKRQSLQWGASMLVVAVDSRNTPALQLYQRSGFQFHRRLQVFWYR